MKTVAVTRVYDPINRANQDTIQFEYKQGQTVQDAVDFTLQRLQIKSGSSIKLSVSINGMTVTEDRWRTLRLTPSQHICIVPILTGGGGGVKDVLRIVGMVIIAIIAVVAQQYWAEGLLWSEFGAAFGLSDAALIGMSAVGGMAIMMTGSYLLNMALPPSRPSASAANGYSSINESNTYSWNPQTTQQQGVSIPWHYGLCKPTGNIVGVYRESVGRTQYLNALISLGEGPLSDITDVLINNQDVSNYSDVQIYTRLGSINQDVIDNFGDTRVEYAISTKVVYGTPITHTTVGNDFDKLEVEVSFANGLYYYNDQGGISNYTVQFLVEYKPSWSSVWDQLTPGTVAATAAQTSPLRYTYRSVMLAPGPYDIRVTKLTTEQTDNRYGDDLYLTGVRELLMDDFTYPGQALIGLRALATDQLSGSFSFSCRTNGKLCRVYRDNAWHVEATSNPAWICFDILTQPLFDNDLNVLEYRAHDATNLDQARWIEWAAYCDDLVPIDTYGNTEKRLTYNGTFDASISMWDAALQVARIGRAAPYWRGTTITVAIDKPADPVTLLSVGNIGLDSFEETFLSMDGRAGTVDADFLNLEKDLDRDKLTVINPNAPVGWGTASLALQGVIKPTEVWRHCRYYLATTLNLIRVVTVQMDIDAIAFTIGDVVNFQHDIPQWGEGGRIVSVTTDTVTLDKLVTMIPGKQYIVMLRLLDGTIVERQVINSSEPTNTLTLILPFDVLPSQFDPYAFGESSVSIKPMRITSIDPAGDLKRKITLTDYNPSVYNADYLVPEVQTYNYSQLDIMPRVLNFSVVERMTKRTDGTIDDFLAISFTPPSGSFKEAQIWISTNGGQFAYVATSSSGNEMLWPCAEGVNYTVVARTVNSLGRLATIEASPQISITTVGKSADPADCSNLLANITSQGVDVTWTGVPDVDLLQYEVRLGAVWEAAIQLAVTVDTRAKLGYLPAGPQYLLVKAWDTTQHDSVNAAQLLVTPQAPGQPQVSGQIVGADCILSWNDATTDYALRQYEIRYGADFYSGTPVAVVTAQTFKLPANWSGNRTFWVRATDAGNNRGTPGGCTVGIEAPSQVQVSAEVIDNNVLLRWTDTTSQLPVLYYEVRKGTAWDSGTTVGTILGRFATLFESAAGIYTYWVAAVNTAGTYAEPAGVTANVAQPPDYVLMYDQDTAWAGTKDHCTISVNGGLIASVDTDETFEQHFTNRGWASPQDQIDAGYPLFLQPTVINGYYEEEIDYGTALAGTMITLTLTRQDISGAIDITPTIYARLLDTDPWTEYPNLWQCFVAGFRYIKVRLDFAAASDTDLLKIDRLNIKMAVKLKNDAGTITANAADVGGTWVPFNISFVDVQSIAVTPQGTTPLVAVYDFTDAPNPTGFYIYLFNQAGTRTTSTVAWSAKGV